MKKYNYNSLKNIRIISGQLKRRKLQISQKLRLRPTKDQVKETLFNWLAPFIINAYCLDCFAGSGALGLEALSRYAAKATLIEIRKDIAKQIQRNISRLEITNAVVFNVNAINYLSQYGTQYDIVFIDPPFHRNLPDQVIELLVQNNWLKPNSLIYVESEVDYVIKRIPKQWHLLRKKISGQVAYRLYSPNLRNTFN